mmetsp:Transcript_6605/g.21390  ORF Transcript_6605/g.21390 Transcript_6605/m.21390 type:complete len:213 (+) Transcript_6605:190-828(+)
MKLHSFSICLPIDSGMNLPTRSLSSQLAASRYMMLRIFLRIIFCCDPLAYEVRRDWFWVRLVKAMENIRMRNPSAVRTSTDASMRDCHLRMRERSLSVVKSMPWNWVRTYLPFTSSQRRRILRKPWSSSPCRSARLTVKTRPLSASDAMRCPAVRFTRVYPTDVLVNTDGALMVYHSFLEKGSTILRLPLPAFFLNVVLPTAMMKYKKGGGR